MKIFLSCCFNWFFYKPARTGSRVVAALARPASGALRAASLAALLGALLPALVSAQAARSYPERPVKVYIGFATGGLPDTVGRLVQQKLADKWGQAVVKIGRAHV